MLNLFRGKPRLEAGMTVEANYNGQGKWYKGQIKKDRGNGTFDIEFENGKNENAVPIKMIKTMETSASYSSLAEKSLDSHVSRFKIPAIEDHLPHMFESAASSKAPSVAGDDHSVASAGSTNSRANKTSISKFFHFGASTPPVSVQATTPVVTVEEKITTDNSGIASQAKASLGNMVESKPIPNLPAKIPENKVSATQATGPRKKLNTTNMKERIRRFYETDSKVIDISDLDLITLPVSELMSLAESVQSLNASRNMIASLLNIHIFSNVVQLDLSHNRLSSLQSVDGGFSALRALKRLDLSRNALTGLSADLLGLSSLEALVLHHNRLSTLPPQNQMNSLKSLRLLDVSHNLLGSVGDELETLMRLDELNLGHNRHDSGREMDLSNIGGRARDLHEKRELFVSKGARRVLVSRAIDVQKRVVAREQQRIVQEYTDSHRSASRGGGSRGASRGGMGSRGGAARERDHLSEGVSSGRASPVAVQ